MIIGHLGAAFAARARWLRVPLAWLIGASLAPDVFRLALELGGVAWPASNQYSHLLPWSAVFAAALGAAAAAARRDLTAGLVVTMMVASHIALDALSGRKPLWVGGPLGLGLQDYQQLEFLLEGGLAAWGWWLVRRSRSAVRAGSVAALCVMLVGQAVYLRYTFEARPYQKRCFEYPLRPCYIRRRELPPDPPVTLAPMGHLKEIPR